MPFDGLPAGRNYTKMGGTKQMVKKGFGKRGLAVLLAAFTLLGTAVELPVTQQTAHAAEDVGLPAETNTSFATARNMMFGTSMAGSFPEGGGRRYYKFTLEQASKLDLTLERSTSSGWCYLIFYDASQTEIYTLSSGSTANSWNDLYLTGGDYYMAVQYNDKLNFSFVANMDSAGESFVETQDSNNDMASNASNISLQKKYKGVLAANDDIDYFKFQVPAAGQITLNLTNSTSNDVTYGVYDDSVNPTYTNTLYRGSKVSQPVLVKAGTYYLAIAKRDVNKGMGSYTFTIDYKKKNTAAPKLKSVKNVSYRTMAVTWGKVSGASGYEVWYATKSNFKGSSLVKNSYDSSVTSVKYSGLKKNKKYYVRVRAYTVVNGVKDYGKWSGKKAVVIKK